MGAVNTKGYNEQPAPQTKFHKGGIDFVSYTNETQHPMHELTQLVYRPPDESNQITNCLWDATNPDFAPTDSLSLFSHNDKSLIYGE